MKTKLTLIVASVLFFVVSGSSSNLSFIASSSQNWQFVQSVGGIELGTPKRDIRRHVLLPIRCDVSGTQTVTVRPTVINSALVCESASITVRSTTIFITIRTTVTNSSNSDSRCPIADLGVLSVGEYSVIYRNPDGSEHPLGSVKIPHQ